MTIVLIQGRQRASLSKSPDVNDQLRTFGKTLATRNPAYRRCSPNIGAHERLEPFRPSAPGSSACGEVRIYRHVIELQVLVLVPDGLRLQRRDLWCNLCCSADKAALRARGQMTVIDEAPADQRLPATLSNDRLLAV